MSDDIVPSHVITPGRLQEAYQACLNQLIASDSLRRLWAKDVSLWPADERARSVGDASLGWLDLPHSLLEYMSRIGACVDGAQRDGFQDVVLIVTDEPHLAMEAAGGDSGESRWRRVFLLDSIEPAAIRSIDEQLDLPRTLFVFASKSGKHIEMHSLFLYFLARLKAHGACDLGRSFVAATEEGSYLAEHASTYGFRAAFIHPPGIPGHFSSLLHLSLLLSGLWRSDGRDLAARVIAMRDLCQSQTRAESNPALSLAALLAAGASDSHNKLLLHGAMSLQPVTHRIAHLVARSTSVGGRGIVPFNASVPFGMEAYRKGAIAVRLSMYGDEDASTQNSEFNAVDDDLPTVSIQLQTPADLGGEMFVWQVATALACSSLGVNPFDQPDARGGSNGSLAAVEDLAAGREFPTTRPRVVEKGLELYAEGDTRLEISTLNFTEALRTFFELRRANSYIAILCFSDGHDPAVQSAFVRMRDELASALDIPVMLNIGTRARHCFSESRTSSASNGLFLIVTAEAACDMAIPGAGYTFGQLQMAFAMAEFAALQSRQQPVMRVHLAAGLKSGLTELEHVFHQALSNTRAVAR
jgi:transaldolase / glucose-6-phosphate isomerase